MNEIEKFLENLTEVYIKKEKIKFEKKINKKILNKKNKIKIILNSLNGEIEQNLIKFLKKYKNKKNINLIDLEKYLIEKYKSEVGKINKLNKI